MKHYDEKQMQENILYLEALSEQYPNIQSAAAEMINLHAILDLPKGTEHFLSDIHGEHEAFRHILNNASGSIREKIDDLFSNTLTSEQRAELATLIYYPKEKLSVYKSEITDIEEWYRLTLIRLLAICRHISSKYTRSKVRKTLPKHYAYIIEELMFGDSGKKDRETYHENILHTIIEAGQADVFILSLCDTIKRLIVDKLHIVGDIFDRGARPDIVLDDIMMHHGVDIQWGNHDILWMGAASGSMACIAAALNNAFSYGNLDTIEVGYGISLRDLSLFAKDVYGGGNVERFMPKGPFADSPYTSNDPLLVADMHKAIAVILFKLEGQLVSRNPNFNMSDRRLLDKIDFENATVTVGEKKYPISDTFFPTVDHDYPYELTKTEKRVMEQLKNAFMASEKLKRHIDFLFAKGGMYKCCNNNLLLHGCIPMNKDGSFMEFDTGNCVLSGKALLDELEKIVRQGRSAPENSPERQKGNDYMWYLWCGKHSPLFGREKMCSFERFFIDDSETHTETRNHYYTLYHDEDACVRILKEFGLSENHGHIINGHVPVIRKKGESPIKANGKLIVIDGGFCRAYQDKTGTAGYTLVYNSYGMRIVTHEPFAGIDNAIKSNKDILSTTKVFDTSENRIRVAQTDDGQTIRNRIEGLSMLLCAYRNGVLKEQ